MSAVAGSTGIAQRNFSSTWGWPLFYGAMTGLLIFLLLIPFPHRRATLYLDEQGCEVLRKEGFTAEQRTAGCLVRAAWRKAETHGFISLRQDGRELILSQSYIVGISQPKADWAGR